VTPSRCDGSPGDSPSFAHLSERRGLGALGDRTADVINHVLLFKLRDPAGDADRLARKLESLPPKIPEIRRFEVGRDIVRSARSYDLALVSEFDSLDALEAYRQHPEHQDVAAFIAEVSEHVAVVDFER
jgi:hypothetical protein